jgi:putative hydrolase of the HAD superfamily
MGTVTPAPKAIFFDMDGTILDWRTGMEESWLASCEAHCDGSFVAADLHAAIRERRDWFWADQARATSGRMDLDASAREIVRRAFEDSALADRGLADRIANDYRARRSEVLAPYPRAIETLASLRDRGVRLALLTNGEARNQRRSVERFGLAPLFECVVIEGEFGCGKPDERVFQHAMHSLSCDASSAWMVGDSLQADIEPAVGLGMHAVWVDADGAGLPRPPTVRPHRVVRLISELVA